MDNEIPSENRLLMMKALEALQGNWGVSVITSAIYLLISFGASSLPVIGSIVSVLINGALILGWSGFILRIVRGEKPEFTMLFDGFQRYAVSLITYVLTLVFIILWSILLIVPGIMAAFSYAMVFFILADDQTITPLAAIKRSKELMDGRRLELFYLCCRFIGWLIVGVVTAGIAFLWVMPYLSTSFALFYQDLLADTDEMPHSEPGTGPVDRGEDLSAVIIERVMAMDRSLKDKEELKKKVEKTVAELTAKVNLSRKEIERIVADVLKDYQKQI